MKADRRRAGRRIRRANKRSQILGAGFLAVGAAAAAAATTFAQFAASLVRSLQESESNKG